MCPNTIFLSLQFLVDRLMPILTITWHGQQNALFVAFKALHVGVIVEHARDMLGFVAVVTVNR